MEIDLKKLTEKWAEPSDEAGDVVVSSRVRHARNLDGVLFPPRAEKEDLRRVCESVDSLVHREPALSGFRRLDINECSSLERAFLKESHIISPELEHGGEYRVLYIEPARSCAIMVNEEDHLRMYCLRSGLQLEPVLQEINKIDEIFGGSLNYAFSEQYGYLTTCPSNVGTGMRASVMLHLPGIVMSNQIENVLNLVRKDGLTVRGYYGENSEFLGDFYQVSNEVTLGKTEEEILESLKSVVEQIVRQEYSARKALFEKKRLYVEDVIWRSYAILTNARSITSQEAFKLLSPIRLGIDRGFFPSLTHHQLNRLIVAVQPAHLQMAEGGNISAEERDLARARFLRGAFGNIDAHN